MNVSKILQTSFEGLKKNPLIGVPPLIAGVLTALLGIVVVGGSIAAGSMAGNMRGDQLASLAVGAGMAALVVMLFGGILSLLAHAMTVSMAREVLDTGKTSIGSGVQMLTARIVDFVVAGLITGLAVGLGMLILFVPGIIAMFFLMFAYPAIVVEGKSGIEALKRSAMLVKDRFGEAATLFAIMAGISIGIMILNAVVGMIPLLGQVAALVVWAAFGGFGALVLVSAFKELTGTPATAGQATGWSAGQQRPEAPVAPKPPPSHEPPPPPPPPPTS